jgi:hypothetical protein
VVSCICCYCCMWYGSMNSDDFSRFLTGVKHGFHTCNECRSTIVHTLDTLIQNHHTKYLLCLDASVATPVQQITSTLTSGMLEQVCSHTNAPDHVYRDFLGFGWGVGPLVSHMQSVGPLCVSTLDS